MSIVILSWKDKKNKYAHVFIYRYINYSMWYNDKEQKMLMSKYPLMIWAQTSVLRKKTLPLKTVTKSVRDFALDLIELMWMYHGVGLAAPQVNQSIRMFAYTQRDTSQKEWELWEEWVMINPKIVHYSSAQEIDKEWCLSLPGLEWEVARAKEITISYTDIKGRQLIKKVTWYNARILQHELDHLDGVLYIDKATKVWEKKWEKGEALFNG